MDDITPQAIEKLQNWLDSKEVQALIAADEIPQVNLVPGKLELILIAHGGNAKQKIERFEELLHAAQIAFVPNGPKRSIPDQGGLLSKLDALNGMVTDPNDMLKGLQEWAQKLNSQPRPELPHRISIAPVDGADPKLTIILSEGSPAQIKTFENKMTRGELGARFVPVGVTYPNGGTEAHLTLKVPLDLQARIQKLNQAADNYTPPQPAAEHVPDEAGTQSAIATALLAQIRDTLPKTETGALHPEHAASVLEELARGIAAMQEEVRPSHVDRLEQNGAGGVSRVAEGEITRPAAPRSSFAGGLKG